MRVSIWAAGVVLSQLSLAFAQSNVTSSTDVTATTITPSGSPVGTASTSTPLSCPGSNGTTYTASNGYQYLIQCDIDHEGGDIGSVGVADFEDCINDCANRTDCVVLSYSGGACYLKANLEPGAYSPGIWGAERMSPAPIPTFPECPAANDTEYTISDGTIFSLQCDIDYYGADITSVGMTGYEITWFEQCLEACGNNTACNAVSLSGSGCYLKSSGANGNAQSGISSAVIVSNSTAAASPSASSSASSTSTTAAVSSSSVPDVCASSPTCPDCNGTMVYTGFSTSPQVATPFKIQCGVDYAAGNLMSVGGTNGGTGFMNCILDCAVTDGCIDVSFLGSECYMKSSIGTEVYNEDVWGARLM